MFPVESRIKPTTPFGLEIRGERVPTSEPEYLRWGKIGFVTVGLGEEMTNEDLVQSLPDEVLSEYGLMEKDGTERPEKIQKLTGGKSRFQLWKYAQENGLTLDDAMRLVRQSAVSMGERALENHGWSPEEVDILVTLSSFPEDDFAYKVQGDLGAENACVIEATNACSSPAIALLHLREYQNQYPNGANVLIVGAETLTPFTDPQNLLLFSDRATGMTFVLGKDIKVITPYAPGVTVREYLDDDDEEVAFTVAKPRYSTDGMDSHEGVIFFRREQKNGRVNTISRTRYREQQRRGDSEVLLRMNGRMVAKWMLGETPILIKEAAETSAIPLEHIKMIIPHQANGKLLTKLPRRLARKTGLPAEHIPPVYNDFEGIGNSSSQTTFHALMRALEGQGISEAQRIEDGDLLILPAFGAGLASAAAVVKVHQRS